MDIAAWLRELGLEQYADAFDANAIDHEVLSELTEADLEKLGVLLGHRKKLLKAIAVLTARAGDAAPALAAEAAPQTDRATGAERRQLTVPKRRSAVRFMCIRSSVSVPMPPSMPKISCTNSGG